MNENQCRCLEIIAQEIKETCSRSTPMEAMSEKDFYNMQVLLKIHKKIENQKIEEK